MELVEKRNETWGIEYMGSITKSVFEKLQSKKQRKMMNDIPIDNFKHFLHCKIFNPVTLTLTVQG